MFLDRALYVGTTIVKHIDAVMNYFNILDSKYIQKWMNK